MGREPNEFSRPTTSTRAGFMEAQGTGVQILMTASTAIKMGACIRGIVAFTSTSTDKAGRSIPAPGRGVLTIARELTPATPAPILDIKYRTRQLAFRRRQIAQWAENEREILAEELSGLTSDASKEFAASRLANIEEEAKRQEKDALATFGMLQGADPRIAPLRRALAVWGLNADDIGVISIHGTSTKANDKNETHVYNDIFKTLQRTPGNAVPVIAQKNLTGHPKGGAAAWMFIGLCQSISSGVVPGNRNADNIDIALRQFEYLMFPSKTIRTDGIRAGLMTSFGFGQVGELISAVPSDNPTFVNRNFTDGEIAYCRSQPSPAASFAARWAGKEAVFKSLGVCSKGAAAAMREIEILPDESGVPQVHLHGAAKEAANGKKVSKVQISLSHSETMAIAFAQATF
ncbi:3-oxoacyl-[acyl-carrier-protein] synthase [Serendipita sp. 407]|nr:3-oxoacyl-[acyl-carrier-protein] synthase [Serendipita sp. 407]